MVLFGLLGVVMVAAILSAWLGPNWGLLAMIVLAIIGTCLAVLHFGGEVFLVLAYGGGFLAMATGLGIAIGSVFHKKNKQP